MTEQYAIGEEKVSIIITRKTGRDLVVSQHSSERWFTSEQAAAEAMARVLSVFIETDTGGGRLGVVAPMHEHRPDRPSLA